MQKSDLLMYSTQSYWWSKNPTIWFDESILAYDMGTRIFPVMGFAHNKQSILKFFVLGYFQQKVVPKFHKNSK